MLFYNNSAKNTCIDVLFIIYMFFAPFCPILMTSIEHKRRSLASALVKLLFSMQSQLCLNILSRAVNLTIVIAVNLVQ